MKAEVLLKICYKPDEAACRYRNYRLIIIKYYQMKSYIILGAMLMLLFSCSRNTPQNVPDEMKAALIEERDFIFRANNAMPAGGRTIQLTSEYTFIVKKDTIDSFLPYFGRAFSAPIGTRRGGIEFVSTDFTYNENKKKNGSYEIEILPKDVSDVQRIFIVLSKNGYGSINVTSQNRQAITFNGQVLRRASLPR